MPMGMVLPVLLFLYGSMLPYRRRFPVVYLDYKVMRRPPIVSKQ